MAAYTNPLHISSGLQLDFTVEAADTAADGFLGYSSTGQLTGFASIPRTRVSGAGNLTEATSAVLTITGGTAAVLTSGLTIQVKLATTGQSGYLSSTDWNTFNNKMGTTLTSAFIFVGNGSNIATGVAMTGPIAITNTGLTSIVAGSIVNADVNNAAGIALTKLAATTASRALVSNGSGFIAAATTTATEIGYVNNVTSPIQTQLNTKLTVTLTSPTSGDVITFNGAAWVNSAAGAGTLPVAGTTNQILRKIDGTNYNTEWHTLVVADLTNLTATVTELNQLTGVTTTTAQYNYLNTTSSNVQTQINSKLTAFLAQNSIWYGNVSNVPTALAAGTDGYVLTSSSGVPSWQPSSSSSLTDGQGTTANGSAVDLGGTVSANINISMAGGFGGLIFDFDGTEFGVGQGTFLDAGTVGISGIVSGDVGAGDYSIAYASGGAASIGMFVSAGGGQSVSFDFDSTTNTVTFNDARTSKKGIEYTSSGYVTGDRSLTDRGYVLGAKTFTGAQTFPDDLLFINNPAATFHYIFSSSAILANRTVTLPLLAGNDTFVFEAFAATLSNKTLTAPKFADLGFIADANGNELIIFDTVTSAVNEITYANAATGTNPRFTATGGDTDVGIDFRAQGAGVYSFLAPTGAGNAQLRLYQNGGTNYTAFTVGSQSGAITYTLPTAVAASNGYVLSSTTGGVLSWIAAGAGDVTLAGSQTITGYKTFQRTTGGGNPAALRIEPVSGDPTSPDDGGIWYDSDDDVLDFQVNGTTVAIAPPAGQSRTLLLNQGGNGSSGLSQDTICFIEAGTSNSVIGSSNFKFSPTPSNLGLGGSAPSGGNNVFGIYNGASNPSGTITNGIQIFSKDSSDGSANATLGLYLEQAVEAIGVFVASHKLKVWINGTEYWVQLDAV